MFDTTLLRTFKAVAQDASFTRAAERLFLTQSAVSAHIRRLEEQANASLFVRNTRSVALTPEGEVLLGYARAILRLNEDARRRLSGTSISQAHLRVGASDEAMSSWLPPLLRQFMQSRPHVSLDIRVASTGLLLAAMGDGELDIVVGSRCHGDQTGHLLWREPLLWAYAREAEPDPAAPLPLALFPEPCPYRDAALAALAGVGRDYRIALVSPSAGSLIAAASAALAVTPVYRSLMTRQVRALPHGHDLPPLPEVEFMVFTAAQDGPDEIAALAGMLVDMAARRGRA